MRRIAQAALTAPFLYCCGCARREIPPRIGAAAPDFRLETLDKKRFYLNEQRGKVVVLVFWTTTCSVCKGEMVELKELDRDLRSQGAVVAAVCADPEDLDAVRRIAEGLGLGYPVLLDRRGQVSADYGVRVFPTTVVVGPAGRVRLRREGYGPPVARQVRGRAESLLEAGDAE